jgi:REP element-mobilizing transposase RayT
LVAERSYFVTLRLKGTLPLSVVRELRRERDELQAQNTDEARWDALRRRQFRRIESILDAAKAGHRFLGVPQVADMVMEALTWLEEKRGWSIVAAVVMPNHLHVLMRNTAGRNDALLDDLARFKNFTARVANRLLRRTGAFWLREDFDHWCRTPQKLEAAIRYVRENPVKGGLVRDSRDWRWMR